MCTKLGQKRCTFKNLEIIYKKPMATPVNELIIVVSLLKIIRVKQCINEVKSAKITYQIKTTNF